MKKNNTCQQSSKGSKARKRSLTIGMDLGDKICHYYVLDSEGELVSEAKHPLILVCSFSTILLEPLYLKGAEGNH